MQQIAQSYQDVKPEGDATYSQQLDQLKRALASHADNSKQPQQQQAAQPAANDRQTKAVADEHRAAEHTLEGGAAVVLGGGATGSAVMLTHASTIISNAASNTYEECVAGQQLSEQEPLQSRGIAFSAFRSAIQPSWY
ncbi:hypothetical protein EPUS_00833 [Endocarpon pusillum Z07020]|uniref:Uncharacterized protein n=1 Tax=Endocarpon pusillum (strain Z07020 / HMAS-L-300199) TaxID=1263415 RepID=U1GQU5_ENDPU|nr:uncharacterized protein EPUS_00833 [Endocarpon pusillum Z07020]ERF74703.1 hypothetical protein EPUS_00833 [Endocarpon pusillum Z07020]